MKLTKKILSLCLTFAIMLSIFPFAFLQSNALVIGAGAPTNLNYYSLGIDISEYQTGGGSNAAYVDFDALKASGCEYVILRVHNGNGRYDYGFKNLYDKARQSGMKLGVYMFTYATTYAQAANEARMIIDYFEANNMYFEYPIWYDIESQSQFSLSNANKEALALGWCETMEAAGYYPGIYSGLQFFNGLSSNFKYDKWIAHYGSNTVNNNYTYTSIAYGQTKQYNALGYAMWQYSFWNKKPNGTYYYRGVWTTPNGSTPVDQLDLDVCYKDYPSIIVNNGYNNCGNGNVTPGVDKTALKEAMDKAIALSYTKYSEKQMRVVRYAHYSALQVFNNYSATQEEVDAVTKTLNDSMNVSGFNEGAVRINGANYKIEDGDCFIFTSSFGEINISNANHAYTMNAICKWDNNRQAFVIKQKFQGNGSNTPAVNLAYDEFMIAAHHGLTNVDSQNGYYTLSAASIGDTVTLYGITIGEYVGVSPGAYARIESSTQTNLVSGKNYTVSGNTAIIEQSKYAESLTNGVASTDVVDIQNKWFAFNTADNSNAIYNPSADGFEGYVIFDLGAKYDLSKVKIHLCNINEYGVNTPWKLQLSVSDDGRNYTDYGTLFPVKESDGNVNTYINELAYWTELDNLNLSGRYVKITVGAVGTWTFLNEIEVYGTEHKEEIHNCVAGDWQIVKEATETQDGLKQKVCVNCGEVLATEVIPATGVIVPEYVLGDVNGNGTLEAADYLLLKKIVLGSMEITVLQQQETAFLRCDVSQDGKEINATDYFKLKRMLLS